MARVSSEVGAVMRTTFSTTDVDAPPTTVLRDTTQPKVRSSSSLLGGVGHGGGHGISSLSWSRSSNHT